MKYTFNEKEHLHTLDGVSLTGTSTVMKVIAKPLTWWASGKAVEVMGWVKPDYKLTAKGYKTKEILNETNRTEKAKDMLENLRSMDEKTYVDLLDRAYRNHYDSLEKSADEGTDLHATLEDFCKITKAGETILDKDINPRILPFVEWVRSNVKRILWSEMHCYNEDLFVGGISDLGVELNNGDYAIVDFKSSKEAYPTHFFQIGGYDHLITKNGGFTKDGEKMFTLDKPIKKHIVIPFGGKVPFVVAVENVDENKQAFKSALELYRIMSKLNAL